ncbi:MAG: Stp1/IreP family PP2C-type Ser/Thr phosphatase [Pseudomonadota bacterium]
MNLSNALEVVRLTDVGQRRDHNEDSVASDIEMGLLVLADGMGGYKAGEVASEIAVLTIVADLKEALLDLEPGQVDAVTGMQAESQLVLDAVANANESIFTVSQTQPQCAGMGTTLVVAMFTNNKLLAGHIGDSRMYRFRGEVLTQITEDHSLLQEQLKSGLITPEQAKVSNNKNLVTRALGIDPAVELELHEHDVETGDIYLLCSDGLTDLVEDDEISAVLGTLHANSNGNGSVATLESVATQLIKMANDNGGKDNISVILAKVTSSFAVEHGWYDKFLHWLR